MAVQILSDLHLESPVAYDTFEITPKAPHLALLGDVGNISKHKDGCLEFFTRQLKQFETVLFVPGNHEAYHSNWDDTLGILLAFEQDVAQDASLGQFVLLDRKQFQVPDTNVVILGCSLFSYVPQNMHFNVSLGLNDFYQIADWDVDMHNEAHKRDVAWLNEKVAALGQTDAKIMILSHWSPTQDPRAIEPAHIGSPITSGFSTDLSEEACFKSPKVRVWAFGHTHYNCDFEIERGGNGGTLRLLANQRGYYFDQAENYDGEKLVELLT